MSADLGLSLWIQDALANPFLNAFFSAITHLGDAGIVWIVIGVILAIPKKTRLGGVTLLLSLLLQYLLGEAIKHVVMRPRPFQSYTFTLLISAPSGSSFPSIHTSSAACSAAVYWVTQKERPESYFKIPIAILAVLIAFSRVYLFVHYTTDVLGGAVFGLFMAWVGIKLTDYIYRRGWLKFIGLTPAND